MPSAFPSLEIKVLTHYPYDLLAYAMVQKEHYELWFDSGFDSGTRTDRRIFICVYVIMKYYYDMPEMDSTLSIKAFGSCGEVII